MTVKDTNTWDTHSRDPSESALIQHHSHLLRGVLKVVCSSDTQIHDPFAGSKGTASGNDTRIGVVIEHPIEENPTSESFHNKIDHNQPGHAVAFTLSCTEIHDLKENPWGSTVGHGVFMRHSGKTQND